MSLVVKTNPVGIDSKISRFQTHIYNRLGWADYESYGRVYKNYKGANVIPELYIGSNEYKEVLFDDNFDATSFFLVDDEIVIGEGGRATVDVSIVFQVKLDKIYPSITHRADEELKEDLYNAVKINNLGFEFTEIKVGVSNVYEDLTLGTNLFNNVKLDDMSNYHVVKLDFEAIYKLKDSCDAIPVPEPTCRPATITDSDGVSTFDVASGGTGACTVLSEINISNSNDSYSVDTLVDLELPNIDFTDSDGTTSSVPSMEDLVCTPLPTPVGWIYNRDYFTLQSTSYKTYDDAWQWLTGTNMDYTDPTNPATFVKLDLATDPTGLTMLDNNEFGNKFRFTKLDGTEKTSATQGYCIDNLTGLAWDDSATSSYSYNNYFGVGGALESLNAANLHGYNDWMAPNSKMLATVANSNIGSYVWNLLPYLTTLIASVNTSTTRPDSVSSIVYMNSRGWFHVTAKTTSVRYIPCRVHYK